MMTGGCPAPSHPQGLRVAMVGPAQSLTGPLGVGGSIVIHPALLLALQTTAAQQIVDMGQTFAQCHVQDRPLEGPRKQEDRKSTRLNSSHVAISYAVFCLKKKSDEHKN